MLRSNVRDQLLDQNGLSYARAAKQTNLTAFLIRTQKVNDLDTGFQHFCLGRLLGKCRSLSVDRVMLGNFWRSLLINRFSQNIEHPSESFLSYRHRDRRPGSHCFHSPYKTIGRSHSDTAHRIVTKMLRHFHHELSALFCRYFNRIIDFRKRTFLKADVKYGTYNLSDHSGAGSSFLFCHSDILTPFLNPHSQAALAAHLLSSGFRGDQLPSNANSHRKFPFGYVLFPSYFIRSPMLRRQFLSIPA